MQYQGGKGNLAKPIARAILDYTSNRSVYLEPFVGGASVLERMAPHFRECFASDIDSNIVEFWKAMQEGFIPPSNLSLDEYQLLKHQPPSPLRTFAGYGCSFGGKWFGGYAKGKFGYTDIDRNYAETSSKIALRKASSFKHNTIFEVCDYRKWIPLENEVVYCDPPYEGTLAYGKRLIDHDIFWNTMEKWSEMTIVFVSELQAPNGWEPIWTKDRKIGFLDSFSEKEWTIEALWTRHS